MKIIDHKLDTENRLQNHVVKACGEVYGSYILKFVVSRW
jgi:hypothetical protein